MNFEKSYDLPYDDVDVGLKKFMAGVYSWMTIGVLITAVVALLMVKTGAVDSLSKSSMFWVVSIIELILVVFFAVRVWKMSKTTATVVYLGYSALNGVTLSSIFLMYAKSSIASTFFIAAVMFGAFSLYGMFAKGDLTRWSRPLMMGLFGVIIVSILNIFMKSSGLQWIISIAGVVLFSLLTIYDTFKLKEQYLSLNSSYDSAITDNVAIFGALTLYLDFINLFLYLLRFFGGNKD
jgi:FtsH-binding integral membrane protein